MVTISRSTQCHYLDPSTCFSTQGSPHILSGSVTLARKGASSGTPIFSSEFVDGFLQKMTDQLKPFPATQVEQAETAPVPLPHHSGKPLSSEDRGHKPRVASSPSPRTLILAQHVGKFTDQSSTLPLLPPRSSSLQSY